MSATLTEPDSAPEADPPTVRDSRLPDASSLEDRMPEWFRTPKRLPVCVLILALAFFFFSRFVPLWHTDLWGHLSYGRLICETGSIPETEPFMPLAEGMPLVDTAWLSQVGGYAAYSLFDDVAVLQFLYAAAITFCLSLLMWRFQRRTGHLGFAVAGLAAFLWMEWLSIKIIRPQLAGLCCYVALFTLLTSRRRRKADWFLVPALMVVWANAHGSFLMGLLLLGAFCAGRAWDVLRRTGQLRAVWRDAKTRRLFLLTELAAAAVLINPYGFQLYAEVFTVASNPNLQVFVEWDALTLRMSQGQAAFAVAVMLIVLMRFSPRRVAGHETLLLIGLGAATLWTSRFLVWWAPVAATSLVLHGHAVFRKYRRTANASGKTAEQRRSLWTVASIGICWIAFAVTPFGSRVIHGIKPDSNDALSDETPIRAAVFLEEHHPQGRVFNPIEWGDYLVWAGPRKPNVFVTSHAHLVPRKIWQDFIQILTVGSGWKELLSRYEVNTVVLNPYRENQQELVRRLRGSLDWSREFEDDRSVIFQRKNPIVTGNAAR